MNPAIGAWQAATWVVRAGPQLVETVGAAGEAMAPYAGSLLDFLPAWTAPAVGGTATATGLYLLRPRGSLHCPPLGRTPGVVEMPGTCPRPLTRRQQGWLESLKSGRDISIKNIDTARLLIENSGLEPYTEQRHGDRPAPPGTFRGDLLNTMNPTADYVHPPGSAPSTHANNPHYNLYFWNGKKGTIIITP